MGRNRRTAVQKYHDRVAGRYDNSYDDAFWKWHDELTWDHLKGFLPRDLATPVIDLGCGTGKWGAKLLKSGYAVTFLDISPQMVDQARATAEKLGRATRARFVQADISDLSSLPAGEFGLALAFGEPICCTPSPQVAMKQIARLLAPEAVLVATLDNRLAAIDYYLAKKDPEEMAKFLRDGKTHWLTKSADEQFLLTTISPGYVRKLAETCGFELLDLIGKTVLPMRHHRQLLDSSEARRRWTKIEKSLHRDPHAIGRAAHLQFACKLRRGS